MPRKPEIYENDDDDDVDSTTPEVKQPKARKLTAYNSYFAEQRRAGKTPAEIGASWKAKKESTTTAVTKGK